MFDEGGLSPFGKCPIYQRIDTIVDIRKKVVFECISERSISILQLKSDESCFSEERLKWLTE